MKARLSLIIFMIAVFTLPALGQEEAKRQKSPQACYQLLATVSYPDSGNVAVIKNKEKKQDMLLKKGDCFEGFCITKIKRAHVELVKEGKRSILGLPLGAGEEFITLVSEHERIVDKATLGKRFSSFSKALKTAFIFPNIERGKIKGLRVVSIKDKELLKDSGLKEGDVILSVNGEPLNSLNGALGLYKKLRDEPALKLKVKRPEGVCEYTYYLNQA